MHPVLKAAIDKPRFAGPYGSDPHDIGFNNHLGGFAMATDSYMKAQLTRWDGRRAANDNTKISYQPPRL